MDAKTRRRTKRGPKQRTRETNSRDREKKKVANQQLFEDDEKREQEKDNFLKLGQNANEASRYSHYNHHTVNFLVNGEVVKYVVQIIPDEGTFSFSNHWKLIVVLISCTIDFNIISDIGSAYTWHGSFFFLVHLGFSFFAFVWYATALFIGCRFSGQLHKFYVGFVGVVIYQGVISFQRFYYSLFSALHSLKYVFLTTHPCFPPWRQCFNLPSAGRNLTLTTGCLIAKGNDIAMMNFGGYFSLVIVLLFVTCISGSVESWWRMATLFVVWAVSCFSFLWIYSITLEGSTVGLEHMFRNPKMRDSQDWLKLLGSGFQKSHEPLLLGFIHIAAISKTMERNLPVIKVSAIVVTFSFIFTLLCISLLFMLTGVAVFANCNPPANTLRKFCTHEEKMDLFDFFMMSFNPAARMLLLKSTMPIAAFSLRPAVYRLFCLCHFSAQIPTHLGFTFGMLFILQNEIMKWRRFSRVFTWRTGSYIVIVFLYLPVLACASLAPIEVSDIFGWAMPGIVYPDLNAIIMSFQMIVVYWVYGSVNFLNDVYVAEPSVRPMGLIVVIIGRYLAMPLGLLETVHAVEAKYRRFGNHMIPYDPRIPWKQSMEYSYWVYVPVVVVPLIACLGKRKQIAEWRASNLKKENGWPQLKMSRFTSFLVGGKCRSTAKHPPAKKQK